MIAGAAANEESTNNKATSAATHFLRIHIPAEPVRYPFPPSPCPSWGNAQTTEAQRVFCSPRTLPSKFARGHREIISKAPHNHNTTAAKGNNNNNNTRVERFHPASCHHVCTPAFSACRRRDTPGGRHHQDDVVLQPPGRHEVRRRCRPRAGGADACAGCDKGAHGAGLRPAVRRPSERGAGSRLRVHEGTPARDVQGRAGFDGRGTQPHYRAHGVVQRAAHGARAGRPCADRRRRSGVRPHAAGARSARVAVRRVRCRVCGAAGEGVPGREGQGDGEASRCAPLCCGHCAFCRQAFVEVDGSCAL
eukprot:Rhum_TRINITY_DN1005_c0_g1::Rhum_TRINITY_DN1005_c0_g1_i1::g.3128::m.3128